eukprot:7843691-Lingulodinium_polyedra.AAC.1
MPRFAESIVLLVAAPLGGGIVRGDRGELTADIRHPQVRGWKRLVRQFTEGDHREAIVCPFPDRDAELVLQGGQVALKVWHGHHMPLVAYAKVTRTQAGVRAVRCDIGTLSIAFRKLAHQVCAQVTPIGWRKTRKLFAPLSLQCLEGMFGGVPVLSPVLRS